MDRYHVMLTSRALRDLDDIYAYIAAHLREPGTALALVDEIERELLSLDHMPNRCPERQHGAYAGKGYRQLLIKNYAAVFRVKEKEKQIIVLTVRYARSDF